MQNFVYRYSVFTIRTKIHHACPPLVLTKLTNAKCGGARKSYHRRLNQHQVVLTVLGWLMYLHLGCPRTAQTINHHFEQCCAAPAQLCLPTYKFLYKVVLGVCLFPGPLDEAGRRALFRELIQEPSMFLEKPPDKMAPVHPAALHH